jgi:Tol biopolymer transport system component
LRTSCGGADEARGVPQQCDLAEVVAAAVARGIHANRRQASTDGSKIAFRSKRDGNPEIYVMNNDGTNQRRLTFNAKQDAEPAWSPNGQKLAFLSDRNGTLNVWVMDSTGAN